MRSDEATTDRTELAYRVAGRAMAAYLQGCRLTALTAAPGRPPWQQVTYEPPKTRPVRMFVRDPGGAMRPTTVAEQKADAQRQATRRDAIVLAAGPVAVALNGGEALDLASLPALEQEWFRRLAGELEPAADAERVAALYQHMAAEARHLLEKPKSWSALEELARALMVQPRVAGGEAVGAILVGRAGKPTTSAPASVTAYRARLRRGS